MARNQKRPDCRQRNLQIPTEVCMKYERAHGLKSGQKPTKKQIIEINEEMIDILEKAIRSVPLSSQDYIEIAEETRRNEERFAAKSKKGGSK